MHSPSEVKALAAVNSPPRAENAAKDPSQWKAKERWSKSSERSVKGQWKDSERQCEGKERRRKAVKGGDFVCLKEDLSLKEDR